MEELKYSDPLLQLVLDQEAVTSEQARDIWEEHERTGKAVRNILIDTQVLAEDELLDIMAGYLGSRAINLPATDIPPDVIHSIPTSVARMYNMVPIESDANSVVLATCDMVSPEVMDELMFVLTRDVSFVLAR